MSSNDDSITSDESSDDADALPAVEDTALADEQTRKRAVWALIAFLGLYIFIDPLLPWWTPNPAIVGALVTGMTTILVSRKVFGGGG